MFFNGLGQFNIGNSFCGFNPCFMPFNFGFNFNTNNFQLPIFNFPGFNLSYGIPSTNIWDFNFNIPAFPQSDFGNFDTFERKEPANNSELSNYNLQKGKELATIAESRMVGNSGYCAKYVQEAISLAGLGPLTKGDAYQMTSILRQNPNFKEINKNNIDVNSLPEGCILVYDRFVRNDSEEFGHVEFTSKSHKGISDGTSETLHPNPSAIFIPV